MHDFTRLAVWQRAQKLAAAVITRARTFPSEHRADLARQLRRSAASVPANIAEGAARGTRREFAHYLAIAAGSASETQSHLHLAYLTGIIDEGEWHRFEDDLDAIRRMLWRLRRSLEAERPDGT